MIDKKKCERFNICLSSVRACCSDGHDVPHDATADDATANALSANATRPVATTVQS